MHRASRILVNKNYIKNYEVNINLLKTIHFWINIINYLWILEAPSTMHTTTCTVSMHLQFNTLFVSWLIVFYITCQRNNNRMFWLKYLWRSAFVHFFINSDIVIIFFVDKLTLYFSSSCCSMQWNNDYGRSFVNVDFWTRVKITAYRSTSLSNAYIFTTLFILLLTTLVGSNIMLPRITLTISISMSNTILQLAQRNEVENCVLIELLNKIKISLEKTFW